MSNLLAIDSGHPDCAVAVADAGRIIHVCTGTLALSPVGWNRGFDRVVVEVPTVRGAATPNPEDLILIATVGCRLAERFARTPEGITEYRPSEWKGNTPKPPHHARMWDELTSSERRLVGDWRTAAAIANACERGARDRWQKPGATYYRASEFPTVKGTKITHDILDAVALALYALGRIRKG